MTDSRAAHTALLAMTLAACSGMSTVTVVWELVEAPSPAVDTARGELVEGVGIETLGGVFTPILEAGCRLPCSRTETFSTAADGQTEIQLSLFRSSGAKLVGEATSLGDYSVVELPAKPRGVVQVEVMFVADESGVRIMARQTDHADSEIILPKR